MTMIISLFFYSKNLDDSIPKIKSEMHNNRFKTQELSRDEKDIIEPDSAQNENGANKAFLGKLNQAISNANQEKSGRVDSANNLESVGMVHCNRHFKKDFKSS